MTIAERHLPCICGKLDNRSIQDIESHKVGVWEKLIDRVEIVVSSIVAYKESHFYSEEEAGIPKPINLTRLIQHGKIKEISATPEEIADFSNYFDRVFIFGIDDGEIESLSLIKSGKLQNTLFCSSDGPAIQALAMIGHSNAGISMETLLKKTGLQKALEYQFGDEFFKKHIAKGSKNYIQRVGIANRG
ncbi:MAG: hypothetical protein U9N83_16740 [Thermodesulfobacteriota bacterium]|nr:hypothetical protein [Thermodesulfobacteriota bacterium]